MADKKISQLTAATTPLAGTEVLPIVQNNTTVKVANNDLRPKQIQSNATSGVLQVVGPAVASTRVMTTPDANFTVARTDAAQSFTGKQTFLTGVESLGSSDFDLFRPNVSGVTPPSTDGIMFGWNLSNGLRDSSLVWGCFSPTWPHASLNINKWDGTTLTEQARFNTSNDFVLNVGNLVIGTSGKGIDFSATANSGGTMTSELLADYEEGTFTPTIVGTTSAGTATYSYALGRYTKIGRMVEIEIAIGWSGGSGTGDLKIGGLPFTPAFYGPMSIGRADSLTLTASNIATAYTSAGEATITLRQYPVGGGSDSAVAYDAAGDLIVGGTFYV